MRSAPGGSKTCCAKLLIRPAKVAICEPSPDYVYGHSCFVALLTPLRATPATEDGP